jgi:hypothetical protein
MRSGKRWSWALGLGLLVPASALGQEGGYHQAPRDYVTPAAPKQFYERDVKGIRYDRFYEEYARGLRFDSVYGAADSQRVEFTADGKSHPGRTGGVAWIQPEEGTWALDPRDLEQGRVIARIKTQQRVKALGYGPTWWTYWWVDKRGGTWRSLFFSQDRPSNPAQSDLTYTYHEGYEWYQSIAKWGGSQWGNCSKSACCMKE